MDENVSTVYAANNYNVSGTPLISNSRPKYSDNAIS